MLKSLSATLLFSFSLLAATDADVVDFVKKQLGQNQAVVLKGIKIKNKIPLENPNGWDAYVLSMDVTLRQQGREQNVTTNDILFVNGNHLSFDFFDLKSGRSLKDQVHPSVPQGLYNDAHLIGGSKNAPHKLLVFSDPVCPFCLDYLPDIIEFVQKHPKDFALYYYHMPLVAIHPAAPIISRAMIAAQMQGRKDVVLKTYKANFEASQTNEQKILEAFNAQMGTNIKPADLKDARIEKHYQEDLKAAEELMVGGTPTLFVDGKFDPTREKYKELVKK